VSGRAAEREREAESGSEWRRVAERGRERQRAAESDREVMARVGGLRR
jgi:hypothetical protein